jgi:hypothetical protein
VSRYFSVFKKIISLWCKNKNGLKKTITTPRKTTLKMFDRVYLWEAVDSASYNIQYDTFVFLHKQWHLIYKFCKPPSPTPLKENNWQR